MLPALISHPPCPYVANLTKHHTNMCASMCIITQQEASKTPPPSSLPSTTTTSHHHAAGNGQQLIPHLVSAPVPWPVSWLVPKGSASRTMIDGAYTVAHVGSSYLVPAALWLLRTAVTVAFQYAAHTLVRQSPAQQQRQRQARLLQMGREQQARLLQGPTNAPHPAAGTSGHQAHHHTGQPQMHSYSSGDMAQQAALAGMQWQQRPLQQHLRQAGAVPDYDTGGASAGDYPQGASSSKGPSAAGSSGSSGAGGPAAAAAAGPMRHSHSDGEMAPEVLRLVSSAITSLPLEWKWGWGQGRQQVQQQVHRQ